MTNAPTSQGAIAYVRRGTSRGTPGEADQRRKIQRWATRAGTRIAQWHVEDAEPIDLALRPVVLQALSSLAGSGPRVLCVAGPAALGDAPWARVVVERLAARVGGRVVYASAVPGLSVPVDLGLALDAHERMLVRLRVMTAPELKKARGAFWGRCPWGYRISPDGMRLEPFEPERSVAETVRLMRLRGLKLRQIAEELKGLGIVGRTGKPLGITRIYELLDEGLGSQRRVLISGGRAAPDDDPPESGLVEKHPTDLALKKRPAGSSAK